MTLKYSTAPLLALASLAPVYAQTARHTGCAKAWAEEPNTLLLTEKDSCSVLSGKPVTGRLNGHTVTLQGDLVEATSDDPQKIEVQRVENVGDACTATCTPEPPGHRGINKREKLGAQSGTAGRKADPNQP